jgi:CubicO group peptidase (beta-lactamase class C family)
MPDNSLKTIKRIGLLFLALLIVGVVWLRVSPPDIVRVASNYAAKIVCSNVFLAGRDPQEVLQTDVMAAGHPVLSVMHVDVERDKGLVRAGLFGVIGQGLSAYRSGFGCTPVSDGNLQLLSEMPHSPAPQSGGQHATWPSGNLVENAPHDRLEQVLNDDKLAGPGWRALVVVHQGQVVGERYAAGFTPDTPLLGWSMAKTVTAGLVGRLVQEGHFDLTTAGLFEEWSVDNRRTIRIADLLGMVSDLQWNEGYGTVSDVTRLLFLEPDMAQAATKIPLAQPDGARIGKVFNYSSGTSVALARYLQNTQSSNEDGLLLPRKYLFTPLGMTTAVMETDARGTLVGGSFMYASARDWARYGQFLLQKGNWMGQQLLPVGFVDWMTQPHPASTDGRYGRGHIWLSPPGSNRPGRNPPFAHRAFWMAGHDGQSVAILPEHNIVVVRMGLTPSKLRYKVAGLAGAVVAALVPADQDSNR